MAILSPDTFLFDSCSLFYFSYCRGQGGKRRQREKERERKSECKRRRGERETRCSDWPVKEGEEEIISIQLVPSSHTNVIRHSSNPPGARGKCKKSY